MTDKPKLDESVLGLIMQQHVVAELNPLMVALEQFAEQAGSDMAPVEALSAITCATAILIYSKTSWDSLETEEEKVEYKTQWIDMFKVALDSCSQTTPEEISNMIQAGIEGRH